MYNPVYQKEIEEMFVALQKFHKVKIMKKQILKKLFKSSFSSEDTAEFSLEQRLMDLALSEGLSKKEASDAVRQIMNIRAAVDLLIEKACNYEDAKQGSQSSDDTSVYRKKGSRRA